MNAVASADSPPRLSTRAESAEPRPDLRMAFFLAAEKLFARHGYHAVSARQIADLALAARLPLLRRRATSRKDSS